MSKFGCKLSHLFSALVLLLSVFTALPGLAKADTDTASEKITLTINDKDGGFKYNGYRIMTAEFNGQYKDDFKYTLNKKYEDVVLDAAKSVDENVKDSASFKKFLRNNKSTNTGESSKMRKFADQLYKNIQKVNDDADENDDAGKKLEPEKTFKSGENPVDVNEKNAGYYLLVDTTADNPKNSHNYSALLLTGLVTRT